MRASIEEYKAVEEAAMKFLRSVAEGNSKYARELFTDEAVLFGYLDGKLEHGSIEQPTKRCVAYQSHNVRQKSPNL